MMEKKEFFEMRASQFRQFLSEEKSLASLFNSIFYWYNHSDEEHKKIIMRKFFPMFQVECFEKLGPSGVDLLYSFLKKMKIKFPTEEKILYPSIFRIMAELMERGWHSDFIRFAKLIGPDMMDEGQEMQ